MRKRKPSTTVIDKELRNLIDRGYVCGGIQRPDGQEGFALTVKGTANAVRTFLGEAIARADGRDFTRAEKDRLRIAIQPLFDMVQGENP